MIIYYVASLAPSYALLFSPFPLHSLLLPGFLLSLPLVLCTIISCTRDNKMIMIIFEYNLI